MRLTDVQWSLIAPFLLPPRRADGRGRPPQNLKPVVEGILWVLRTGARRRDLPEEFPPHQTCWRWFNRWSKEGAWLQVQGALLRKLDEAGKLNWEEGFIDATFSPAKKRGACVGPTKRGKGTKVMAVVDGHGLPLSATVHSASPAEVKLAPDVFARIPSKRRPRRVIGDKAYDCGRRWSSVATRTAPPRSPRCSAPTTAPSRSSITRARALRGSLEPIK